MDRPNAWFERARPGIAYSRYTQNNDNYSGVYEYKKQTPVIISTTKTLERSRNY